ncbi:MAG: AraC family transcriptional regulator [Lysinibacillus sp.]
MIETLVATNTIHVHQHSYWNPIEAFELSHDTYPHWSLFFIEEGEMEYKYYETIGIAKFGDIIVCPPGYPLFRKVVKRMKFHFFQISSETATEAFLQLGVYSLKNLERLHSTYSFFSKLTFSEDAHSKQIKAHLLYDILIQFLIEHELFILEEAPKIKDEIINEVLNFISENYKDKISLQQLAQEHHLTSPQLTRRFTKQIGINPIEYLSMTRLRLVRTLLLETADNLETIAEKCGFQNGFYLSRKFKKVMGISPSEFRKINRM